MSVQFGRWNFDGRPIDHDYLKRVKPLLAPYGPDDFATHTGANVGIIYCAFHTTKESRHESQPFLTPSKAFLTWDGRLDNRDELISALGDDLTPDCPDVSIVAATYERWGSDGFARLIGDWALSIWEPSTHSLFLAKDPIGIRHLYYTLEDNQVTWSTILDPLVLLPDRKFALCEEYIAGWFSFFPATHLTPYAGIHAVPPSALVLIRNGQANVRTYWDFDPTMGIRYHSDTEYEEHFRAAFREAVRRRLRSDKPILAELSGGMDSSSIVCMADRILGSGSAQTPHLDTVSYFDDSEPHWNERPYFTKVEEKRGHIGCHINLRADGKNALGLKFTSDRFLPTPWSDPSRASESRRQFIECLNLHGARALLSGIGGDEVTGGVPTPTWELADLMVQGQLRILGSQLKAWALSKRKPWFHLFFEAARSFLPLSSMPAAKRPAAWLCSEFVKRNRAALCGYDQRLRLFGPLPSFQVNMATLHALRRQLSCVALPLEPLYEKRYPFLDRDLLQFLYAIPRHQLLRPGHRRSLMRRALVGIVPDGVLNRKRKAFVSRSPLNSIVKEWDFLVGLSQDMISTSLGIVRPEIWCETLEKAMQGREIPVVLVLHTLSVESWLRNIRERGIISTSTLSEPRWPSSSEPEKKLIADPMKIFAG